MHPQHTSIRDGNHVDETIETEARDWLVLFSSGTVSEDDIVRFRVWQRRSPVHATTFERERQVWADLGRLSARLGAAPVPVRHSRRAVLAGGLAMTAVAGGIAVPDLWLTLRSDFRTTYGEQQTAELPDGTRVLLNTGTAIALDFNGRQRGARLLQGEALFDVAPNGNLPFILTGGEVQGRTMAGRLALRRDDERFAMTSADAVVTLSAGGVSALPLQLPPAHQAGWLSGGRPGAAIPVDLDRALAWREGRIVFAAEPFPQAARDLARYLPETLLLRGRATHPAEVSGRFAVTDARDALTALARTRGLTVRRLPGLALIIS